MKRMMRKPRLLVDVDGVLTHSFTHRVCELLRLEGYDASFDKIDQWDIMRSFDVPKTLANAIYDKMKQQGVASAFEPIEGSQDFICDVSTWADVYAVTSPMNGPFWAHDRETWLQQHYGISHRRVVSVQDKFVVYGDALVDDKLAHLVEWSDAFPHGRAILWRIPPNRNDHWPLEAMTYDELRTLLEPIRARFGA
jgi:5'(3')-deoxyribonucleotidase